MKNPPEVRYAIYEWPQIHFKFSSICELLFGINLSKLFSTLLLILNKKIKMLTKFLSLLISIIGVVIVFLKRDKNINAGQFLLHYI